MAIDFPPGRQLHSSDNTEPRWKIPVGAKVSGANTENDYQAVTSSFLNLFSIRAITQSGYQIFPEFDWNDEIIMGGSQLDQTAKQFHLFYKGGLARLPGTHRLTTAYILCHELGHLLGGEPRQTQVPGGEWAACEGQADDWSIRVCLRDWLQKQPELFADDELEPDSKNLCLDQKNIKLCQQLISAGYLFFKNSQIWQQSNEVPSLQMHDPTQVTKTNLDYPNIQCRVDTVVHAALGLPRPRCWFNQ